MKSFKEYITELFDRPYPYKFYVGTPGKSGQSVVLFHPNEGDKVRVILDYFGDSLYLAFTRGGEKKMGITGQGNAERIFATVMEILDEFLENAKPRDIEFIAEMDGSGARIRIYKKMIERYAKRKGYRLVSTDEKNPGEIRFKLTEI